MIEFQCPICTRVLKISPEHAGEEGACRYCGGRIVVPTDIPSSEDPPPDFSPNITDRREAERVQLSGQIDSLKSTVRNLQVQLDQNREEMQQIAGQLERITADVRAGKVDTKTHLTAIQGQIAALNEQYLTPVSTAMANPEPAKETERLPKTCPLCARFPYLMAAALLAAVVLAVIFFVDLPVLANIRHMLQTFISNIF